MIPTLRDAAQAVMADLDATGLVSDDATDALRVALAAEPEMCTGQCGREAVEDGICDECRARGPEPRDAGWTAGRDAAAQVADAYAAARRRGGYDVGEIQTATQIADAIRHLTPPVPSAPAPEAPAESVGVRGSAMLPEGKRCGDCFHVERCVMLGCTLSRNIMCDWSPSRFATVPLHQRPAPVEPEEIRR